MKRLSVVFGVIALSFGLLLGQTGSGQMGEPMGPTVQTQDPVRLQMEIHLLQAINQAGLTRDQLEQLQAIVSELKTAQDSVLKRQQKLRDFLLDWQGNPEEFDAALQSFQRETQQAQRDIQQQRQAAVERLKSVLTFRQGEVLLNVLGRRPDETPQMGVRGRGMMAPSGPPQMGHMMDQMEQHMRAMTEKMRQHMALSQQGMGMMGQGMMGQMQQHHQQMMERMQSMMARIGRIRGMMGNMGPGPMMEQHPNLPEVFLQHLDLWEDILSEKLARLKGEM